MSSFQMQIEECYDYLLRHRHGPSISLAGLANGMSLSMKAVDALVDALEDQGRARVVRYDGAPWSYHAIPPAPPPPVNWRARALEAENALRRSKCSCWDHTCARCAHLEKYDVRQEPPGRV